jgi:cell division protein FtsW
LQRHCDGGADFHINDVTTLVRRLAVLGFVASFIALMGLPFFGTDFGKGALRWYSLGFFASLQPSRFLKPGLSLLPHGFVAASRGRQAAVKHIR